MYFCIEKKALVEGTIGNFYGGIRETNIGYTIRKEEQKRILFFIGIKYNTYAGNEGYGVEI